MISRAESRYIRITPRKFRQIIPLVKGKNVDFAMATLMSLNKKAAVYAIELLKSSLANAKRLPDIEQSNLYISKLVANCGPMLKRFRAGSMGRASVIRKHTSHVVMELDAITRKSHKNKEKKVKPAEVKVREQPAKRK